MTFKIGDQVELIRLVDGRRGYLGQRGTVMGFVGRSIAVDFGMDMPNGHACSGFCGQHSGLWVQGDDIRLAGPCKVDCFAAFIRAHDRQAAEAHN